MDTSTPQYFCDQCTEYGVWMTLQNGQNSQHWVKVGEINHRDSDMPLCFILSSGAGWPKLGQARAGGGSIVDAKDQASKQGLGN